MPPKKATKKDTPAAAAVATVTTLSPTKESPEKKKAAKKATAAKPKTNGVAKEEKPAIAKEAVSSPKKKKVSKAEEAGGSNESPKKKATKKRTKSDAETSSGVEGSPMKNAKKTEAPKPKKEKPAKKTVDTKKRKAKESGSESTGAEGGSPKKKKKATEADVEEKTVKKSKKKKEDPDGAAVKVEKKSTSKKKTAAAAEVESSDAVAKSGADSGTPKKVKKPRARKPKPVEDETPVVSVRKNFKPIPTAMPTLLKKAATSKGKPAKKPADTDEDSTATSDQETTSKSAGSEKEPAVAKKKKLLNATETNWEDQQFMINESFRLKIASWNVSGLRAWLEKGGKKYLLHERPDIICLQETKCKPENIPDDAAFPGYHPYWLGFGGQAGVGLYSRQMPLNISYGIDDKEMDEDGRLMCAEYEKFFLVNVYVPNAGRKLVTLPKRLRWNKLFKEYIKKLDQKKPVIICGDMNVAHEEIDLANPKTNKKNAGFTQEERDGMTDFLATNQFVDTFRNFYPDEKGAYTFWTYMSNARAKNVGWRLDYILVSHRILDKVVDNRIRNAVLGSDHCPIVGFFNL